MPCPMTSGSKRVSRCWIIHFLNLDAKTQLASAKRPHRGVPTRNLAGLPGFARSYFFTSSFEWQEKKKQRERERERERERLIFTDGNSIPQITFATTIRSDNPFARLLEIPGIFGAHNRRRTSVSNLNKLQVSLLFARGFLCTSLVA